MPIFVSTDAEEDGDFVMAVMVVGNSDGPIVAVGILQAQKDLGTAVIPDKLHGEILGRRHFPDFANFKCGMLLAGLQFMSLIIYHRYGLVGHV